ncbi:E3 SUMO-protein ligase ZNF451 isoform X1 [Takifugu flavidus]|uniref:E3 SUMO-protein ligase ZNF451 isoform X1 n=1 Tax=Takifugu flavidus TaxID=433684 RepID=UPI002544BE42|nr:E3 SUMO-protein ligase ZNF451 isoform X1 [Takifugu flavidus]
MKVQEVVWTDCRHITRQMSTEADDDEMEEVEFISEAPPELECIDLGSDSEDEGFSSSLTGTLDDKITCHKARVTSTLERLAQQVAQDKEERAKKCKAFKEKQNRQKAHGQQELAFSSADGINQEAKRCVDMWLKMPAFGAGSRKRQRTASFPVSTASKHTCPVVNCGRVFDNTPLLEGHLKRFDHSPCDPTINLKGCPSELFACAACAQHFQSKEEWRKHLESKVNLLTPDGHSSPQTYQRIVCFACPACFLFFNLRDECLQHMAAKNHFSESLPLTETKIRALPVPVPQYVKNRLITLCKEIMFSVRCSLCHKVLTSHQTAQAHFNVHCRHGCAVAKADKTVAQVMQRLQVRGQCSLCRQLFFSQAEIASHKEATHHGVEINRTMQRAVLQHCRFSGTQHTGGERAAPKGGRPSCLKTPHQKMNKEGFEEYSTRRKRPAPGESDGASSSSPVGWRCECGLQFSEEAAAKKHLLAANQIFHQCGVCGKHMEESAITRLHMSRFHGGAHLSNFLFYCRKCKIEMPRYEDILSHVSDDHGGHTYITEQEMPEELAAACDAQPSTSHASAPASRFSSSSVKLELSWMCRMCEDVFDSEKEVLEHCSDVTSHSFQRFMCGHCPQKFFKESTVRRHCVNEHGGQIKSFHFCGLCDSMQLESEGEFLEHYKRLHSKDFYCINSDGVIQSTVQPTCPCMGSEKNKGELKAVYTQCMRDLATEGKCQYACAPCGVSVSSYAQIKTHVHTKHPALNLEKTFEVACGICQESFKDVPSFHKHHHSRHCALEPCMSSRSRGAEREPAPVKILDAVEIKPGTSEICDETLAAFLNEDQANKDRHVRKDGASDAASVSAEARESAELEEALQRSLLEF